MCIVAQTPTLMTVGVYLSIFIKMDNMDLSPNGARVSDLNAD
jgi:hypothetical protein